MKRGAFLCDEGYGYKTKFLRILKALPQSGLVQQITAPEQKRVA